jgi:hypothetical protein
MASSGFGGLAAVPTHARPANRAVHLAMGAEDVASCTAACRPAHAQQRAWRECAKRHGGDGDWRAKVVGPHDARVCGEIRAPINARTRSARPSRNADRINALPIGAMGSIRVAHWSYGEYRSARVCWKTVNDRLDGVAPSSLSGASASSSLRMIRSSPWKLRTRNHDQERPSGRLDPLHKLRPELTVGTASDQRTYMLERDADFRRIGEHCWFTEWPK